MENSEHDRQDAFSQAMAIEFEADRIDALISLAEQTEGEEKTKFLEAALDTALKIPIKRGLEKTDRFFKQQVLIRLIPHLTGELQLKLRDAANGFTHVHTKAWILTFLMPYLEGKMQADTLGVAFIQALQIEDELDRANMLSHLAPYFFQETIDQVLGVIDAIKVRQYRSRVLASLLPNATEAQKERIFEATMALANGWAENLPSYSDMHEPLKDELHRIDLESEEWYRAYVLRELVPHTAGDMQNRAIEAILSLEKDDALADSFADISGYLYGEQLERALQKAKAIRSDQSRAIALASLANRFSKNKINDLIAQAREAASKVDGPQDRARCLIHIGRVCVPLKQAELFSEALDVIKDIHYEEERCREFTQLAPDLPDELLNQALEVVDSLSEDMWVDWANNALAKRFNIRSKD